MKERITEHFSFQIGPLLRTELVNRSAASLIELNWVN